MPNSISPAVSIMDNHIHESIPTPFDRISVRRLLLYVEKAIKDRMENYLFEPNDRLTRLRMTESLNDYLDMVKVRQGIHDFKIICDETNNTPEYIDLGQLNLDVYIQPRHSVHFVNLHMTSTRESVEFDSLGMNGGSHQPLEVIIEHREPVPAEFFRME